MRKTTIGVETTWRLSWLISSVVLAGCATLVNPPNQPTAAEYDLSGRMRIKTDESILRLDFYVAYDGRSTTLQIWGPLGVGRTKVRLDKNAYLIENRKGSWAELHPSDLPYELPMSVWRIGADLGEWLQLTPSALRVDEPLSEWSLDGVDVNVEKSQIVNGRNVCRRMKLQSGTAEVLVLCDRWRSFR